MPTQREYWLAIDSEAVDLAKKGVSDWSPVAEVTVAGDDLAPAAPSISASSADQAIDLELTKPSLNADGTTCVDFKEFKVYHSTSSGIDITDPSSYDGHFFTSSTKHTFPTSEETYFVATAWDKNGNEGAPSSEVSATPTASGYSPSIDDYTNNISSVVTGDGLIGIEFQPPKPTWVRWAGWRLYYDVDEGSGWSGSWTLIYTGSGPGFLHKGLNTAYAYKYKLTVLSEDGTETSGTVSDNSGSGYTPNASDNSSLTSVTIFAERIVATDEVRAANIKAGTITADRLAFSAFDKGSDTLDDITDGTTYGRILKTDISAGHILLSETIGDLDDIPDGSTYGRVASTDISAGHITVVSEQASININNSTFGSQGIQLQYNGGTPRAYIGDGSSNYFKFDGTDVSISGALTAGSGSSIDGAYIVDATITNAKISDLSFSKITAGTSSASITIGSSGYIKSSNYSAGSDGFKINGSGDAEFNDVTVRGTIYASSGTWHGNAIEHGYIASNAVRTNELYIDGDVDFAADGTRHSIKGIQDLYADSGGSTSYAYIKINAGNVGIYESSSGSSINVDTNINISAAGHIYLTADYVYGVFKYHSGASHTQYSSTTWTTLDLSSWVGAQRALVLLEVYNRSSTNASYIFRPNGWTVEQGYTAANWPGAFSTAVETGHRYNYVWCMTGTDGKVQWRTDTGGLYTTIYLIASIR